MSKRRYEAVILAALLLGSCNDRVRISSYDLARTANANALSALLRIEELESEVRELKQDLEDLDAREKRLTDATISDLQDLNQNVSDFQNTYSRHTH